MVSKECGKCKPLRPSQAQFQSRGAVVRLDTVDLQVLNLRLWSAAAPGVQINLLDLLHRLALVRSPTCEQLSPY